MAKASKPERVKLICGIISARKDLLAGAIEALGKSFGPIDIVGEVMPFDMTDYYEDQMSSPLHRQFVSFTEPVEPDFLIEAKLATNAIEADFAARCAGEAGPARPINLDPGYIAPSKLVLASMKNFSHRIYLGRGVYAEITLMYRKAVWEPLAWTFPDYASGRYDAFLSEARSRLRQAGGKEDTL